MAGGVKAIVRLGWSSLAVLAECSIIVIGFDALQRAVLDPFFIVAVLPINMTWGVEKKAMRCCTVCAEVSASVWSTGNGSVEPFCLPRVRNRNATCRNAG